MQVTVSEALGLMKTLKQRHEELKSLRSENATRETRYFGANADKSTDKVPVYSVTKLDKTVNVLAMEIRKLDAAIKRHNAVTTLDGYDWSEDVLGVIETE